MQSNAPSQALQTPSPQPPPIIIGGYEWSPNDIRPDVSHIETEDETPVDNLFSEKQMRLLTETLYASWWREKPFLAMADVGLFFGVRQPPLVPDVMVSLDVEPATDWFQKEHRSYFVWEFGKSPEVVIEIISNFKGEELGSKLEKYATANVPYYVVFDPARYYGEPPLRIFERTVLEYQPMQTVTTPSGAEYTPLSLVGLGLRSWEGVFEGRHDVWLRWCDSDGVVIPTGKERAEQEKLRAEQEKQRADSAEARATALAAKLRALGIDPDAV
jgi:Uma2 family endonuclease